MPISRIKTDGIQDEAVTSAKIGDNIDLDGQFVRVPHGTTAQRPSSPVAGYLRFNTDQGTLEQWNTNTLSWAGVDSPPIVTSIAYTGSATAADPAGGETITITGTNFRTGVTVRVGGTTAPTVSFVNSTTITFTTPVKTAGDYDLVVTNPNGLTATLVSGVSYNGLPAFTTTAGNVGSVDGGDVMSTITIVAAEPDGGTLAYSITSGALPSGVSLNSANGQLTGTPVSPSSTTTFNFTVTATDDENQTNSRAFNLIVIRPIYATSLDDSLRFNDNDSAYLSRTPTAAGNRKTWTLSSWVKRGNLSEGRVFTAGLYDDIKFDSTNSLTVQISNNNVSAQAIVTNAVFRDSSAWYHIVVACDTTQATASNRLKLYVNGSEITSFSTDQRSSITQSQDTYVSNNSVQRIGVDENTSYFDGYLSDVHFIDGQALTPTSFAEEYYGVWVPKAYSGSYGTNGFKLDFADNSAIGNDVSGNNNDWTPNNFGTSDVVPDSPTKNFATLNPRSVEYLSQLTYAEGNLRAINSTVHKTFFANMGVSSGKWYWEAKAIGGNKFTIGLTDVNNQRYKQVAGTNAIIGYSPSIWNFGDSVGIYARTLAKNGSTVTNNLWSSYLDGDIMGIAFDADTGKVWFHQNGIWANGAGTDSSTLDPNNHDTTVATGETYIPAFSIETPTSWYTNFGQDSTFAGNETAGGNTDANNIGDFKYAVPSGYLALCAKNLSESTINTKQDDRPEDYFDTVVYNGNGFPTSGTQSITSLTFQPDLVWIKNRARSSYHHYLVDSVRGATKVLKLPLANVQGTEVSSVTSFDSNGFTLGNNNEVNYENDSHVAWCWKAGGAPTATNSAGAGNVPTSGSVMIDGVASTSALAGSNPAKKLTVNTKSGFSIVEWTHTSDNPQTIAHGLGVTPAMMIIRSSDAVTQWWTWHKGLSNPAQSFIFVNNTDAAGANTSAWGNTAPTSSVFTLIPYILSSGNTGIAYCFAEVEGFSKFGSYTGNGKNAGPFIYTGFRPAFILVKSTSSGRNWALYDNKRDIDNPLGAYLISNTNDAEFNSAETYAPFDFVSNGFKLVRGPDDVSGTVNSDVNTDGQTYIYMTFAENPFKYAEAR